MKNFFALPCWLIPSLCFSQDENLLYRDHTYLDNIRTVQFQPDGQYSALPVYEMGGNVLALSFDDLDGDSKDYLYAVVHCDAKWQPSSLSENEYVDGFAEDRIEDFEYSFKTKSVFTNYYLTLPNEDMRFTKSGNYLLKVYDNQDDKRLAITRRFMVVEPRVRVAPDVTRPAQVGKSNSHQEIDFRVEHPSFEIRNPRQELTVFVLQNGRWDSALTGFLPMFSRLHEQVYDLQDKIVFPAGKEFRPLDLRSIEYRTQDVAGIEYANEKYEVTLERDEKRGHGAYLEYRELDGGFVIQNFDETNADLESEYVGVFFSFASPAELEGCDLYVFGGLTDWDILPRFKMAFNPALNAYVGKASLKQGYYNYLYAAVPKGKTAPLDFEETEGDWYETKNTYTILVYYRPFGGRYDSLIGVETFNSRQ